MAPRRSVKNVYVTNNINYNNLILNDVLCPICRSILVEPVTLPCNHSFCSSCFQGTVANANLVCPLCRVRIGSWLRKSKKDNKIVNLILWEAIKKHFPTQVQNKLEGNEDYLEEDVPKRFTTPGEIRREYELQKAKEDSELVKERETEAKASEAYIKKLKEQEEYEEALRLENLKLSEQVAKKLAEEYSFDPGPSSSKTNVVVPSKKHGPIDILLKNMSRRKLDVTIQPASETNTKQYTCKILCQDKTASLDNIGEKGGLLRWKLHDKFRKILVEGEASDSNDSIDSECLFFKPINPCAPLPRKVSVIKVPTKINKAATVIIRPPTGEIMFNCFINSAFAKFKAKVDLDGSFKRKLSEEVNNERNTHKETKLQHKNEKTPIENKDNMSNCVNTLSKRRRLETHSLVTTRENTKVVSPPFCGFENQSRVKSNGVIRADTSIVNYNGKLKQMQEAEDMKLARKLHEELNTRRRHSTRNSINVQYKNSKKSHARQTTLKEIITQTVTKIPKV